MQWPYSAGPKKEIHAYYVTLKISEVAASLVLSELQSKQVN